MPATTTQPSPQPNEGIHIHDLVARRLLATAHPMDEQIASDIAARKRLGIERYGSPLQPGNGRDSLVDAYQEALDLIVYTEQAIFEQRVHGLCVDYLRGIVTQPARQLRWLLDRAGGSDAAV